MAARWICIPGGLYFESDYCGPDRLAMEFDCYPLHGRLYGRRRGSFKMNRRKRLFHKIRFHYETLGRGAHVIKGVAGDEVELRLAALMKGGDVVGRNDGGGYDLVAKIIAAVIEGDDVALMDVLQNAEVGVAMSGNDAVAWSSWHGGSGHVSRSAAKIGIVATFYDEELGVEARDGQFRDRGSGQDMRCYRNGMDRGRDLGTEVVSYLGLAPVRFDDFASAKKE